MTFLFNRKLCLALKCPVLERGIKKDTVEFFTVPIFMGAVIRMLLILRDGFFNIYSCVVQISLYEIASKAC